MPWAKIYDFANLKKNKNKEIKNKIKNKNKIKLFERNITVYDIKCKGCNDTIYILKYSFDKILEKTNISQKNLNEYIDFLIVKNKKHYSINSMNEFLQKNKTLKEKEKEIKEENIQNNNILLFEQNLHFGNEKSEKIQIIDTINEESENNNILKRNESKEELINSRLTTQEDLDSLRNEIIERPIKIRRIIYRVRKFRIKKKY